MEIPGDKIAKAIESTLKKEVKKLKKPIKLITILIGDSPHQLSFVAIKRKVATRLGIKFEFVHLTKTPSFEEFANLVKTRAAEKSTTGMIIQQPLPSQLDTNSIYDFIPLAKEIEGHRRKTTFAPPLGLAVLTMLKYVYAQKKVDENLLINFNKEVGLFKRLLRNEKVVLAGRGLTGGKSIGKALTEAGVNYINVHSETPNPTDYYKEADVIITAVGRKVLTAEMLKNGVLLINAGLRREKDRLRGDYDENEIKNIASWYTKTPGGVGPIDVLYLYKNLVEAAKMQR